MSEEKFIEMCEIMKSVVYNNRDSESHIMIDDKQPPVKEIDRYYE